MGGLIQRLDNIYISCILLLKFVEKSNRKISNKFFAEKAKGEDIMNKDINRSKMITSFEEAVEAIKGRLQMINEKPALIICGTYRYNDSKAFLNKEALKFVNKLNKNAKYGWLETEYISFKDDYYLAKLNVSSEPQGGYGDFKNNGFKVNMNSDLFGETYFGGQSFRFFIQEEDFLGVSREVLSKMSEEEKLLFFKEI